MILVRWLLLIVLCAAHRDVSAADGMGAGSDITQMPPTATAVSAQIQQGLFHKATGFPLTSLFSRKPKQPPVPTPTSPPAPSKMAQTVQMVADGKQAAGSLANATGNLVEGLRILDRNGVLAPRPPSPSTSSSSGPSLQPPTVTEINTTTALMSLQSPRSGGVQLVPFIGSPMPAPTTIPVGPYTKSSATGDVANAARHAEGATANLLGIVQNAPAVAHAVAGAGASLTVVASAAAQETGDRFAAHGHHLVSRVDQAVSTQASKTRSMVKRAPIAILFAIFGGRLITKGINFYTEGSNLIIDAEKFYKEEDKNKKNSWIARGAKKKWEGIKLMAGGTVVGVGGVLGSFYIGRGPNTPPSIQPSHLTIDTFQPHSPLRSPRRLDLLSPPPAVVPLQLPSPSSAPIVSLSSVPQRRSPATVTIAGS